MRLTAMNNNLDKSPSIIRQEWIENAVKKFRAHFWQCGWDVPNNIRLSIGFPVAGQRDGKRTLGICHNQQDSRDGHWEIFISPNYADTVEILETIAHEMIHATVNEPGHKSKFKRCAIAVGFIGPFSFTPAGPKMLELINQIKVELGEFPAQQLDLSKRKKQKTNMKKCECDDCGYIAYTTMKWIDKFGEPICPQDNIQMVCVAVDNEIE